MTFDFRKKNLYNSLKKLSQRLVSDRFGVEYQQQNNILNIIIYYLVTDKDTHKQSQRKKIIKTQHDNFLKMDTIRQYNFVKNRLK